MKFLNLSFTSLTLWASTSLVIATDTTVVEKAILDLDRINNITQAAVERASTSGETMGSVRENADAVLLLVQLGTNLTSINADQPKSNNTLEKGDQAKICSNFNGPFYRAQYRMTAAVTSGINKPEKGAWTGYYAELLRKIWPLMDDFEDSMIELIPNCNETARRIKGRVGTFYDDALDKMYSGPFYTELHLPDFDLMEG